MYVRTYVVRTYRKMSRSGMLIGMLRVSCRPIDLLRGLDGARTTTLRNRSVDERAVLQGLQSWNSYIWSQTVDICLYRNSTIISRSQRLGYKRTGPSGLAELEQLHVESNSETCLSQLHTRKFTLSYHTTRKHVARLLMRPRHARKAIMRIRIPS